MKVTKKALKSSHCLKRYCVFPILTVSCYNNQFVQATGEEILISSFSYQCPHLKLNQYVKWSNCIYVYH